MTMRYLPSTITIEPTPSDRAHWLAFAAQLERMNVRQLTAKVLRDASRMEAIPVAQFNSLQRVVGRACK